MEETMSLLPTHVCVEKHGSSHMIIWTCHMPYNTNFAFACRFCRRIILLGGQYYSEAYLRSYYKECKWLQDESMVVLVHGRRFSKIFDKWIVVHLFHMLHNQPYKTPTHSGKKNQWWRIGTCATNVANKTGHYNLVSSGWWDPLLACAYGILLATRLATALS